MCVCMCVCMCVYLHVCVRMCMHVWLHVPLAWPEDCLLMALLAPSNGQSSQFLIFTHSPSMCFDFVVDGSLLIVMPSVQPLETRHLSPLPWIQMPCQSHNSLNAFPL